MLAFFLFFRCGWKLERKRVKRCSKVLILNSSVINGLGAKSKMCLQLGSIADFLGRLSTSVDISLYLVLVLLHSSSSFNSLKIQLVASASFFSFFKLEYNCFTMLCSFLLYSDFSSYRSLAWINYCIGGCNMGIFLYWSIIALQC